MRSRRKAISWRSMRVGRRACSEPLETTTGRIEATTGARRATTVASDAIPGPGRAAIEGPAGITEARRGITEGREAFAEGSDDITEPSGGVHEPFARSILRTLGTFSDAKRAGRARAVGLAGEMWRWPTKQAGPVDICLGSAPGQTIHGST